LDGIQQNSKDLVDFHPTFPVTDNDDGPLQFISRKDSCLSNNPELKASLFEFFNTQPNLLFDMGDQNCVARVSYLDIDFHCHWIELKLSFLFLPNSNRTFSLKPRQQKSMILWSIPLNTQAKLAIPRALL